MLETKSAMLAQDEEVDIFEYREYLTAQSDDDLCDIARHLDPTQCPRRSEAAQRELIRRRVLVAPAFSPIENALRYFALFIIVLCAATVLLGLTMSPDEARAPQTPPTVNIDLSNGLTASAGDGAASGESGMTANVLWVVAWQNAQNVLRTIVLGLSDAGGYLLVFVATAMMLAPWLRRRPDNAPGRAVRGLVLAALVCQILMFAVCALSSVPTLVNGGEDVSGGFLARAVTLLAPWG